MTTVAAPRKIAAVATSNATLAKGRHTPVDASGGARTMSLPGTAPVGSVVSVEKEDSSANAVTISGTIRGSANSSITLATQFECIDLVCDGAGAWWPIAGHRTKTALDATYGRKSESVGYRCRVDGSGNVVASGGTWEARPAGYKFVISVGADPAPTDQVAGDQRSIPVTS